MGDLPADELRAIKMLRQLLEQESDAIDRHFMHAHLEALLYRSRDVFASALEEYDQACRQHDAEMDGIRAAFMAKWGRLSVLETYRQMAIRQQKAKNFEQALWWAERGIAIYGTDCARPDALDDLQKRAESYRAKLNPHRRGDRSPLSVRNYRRAYRLAARRASLDRLDLHEPHDLRHTFATWLEDAGIPVRVIDELMGHRAARAGSGEARGSAIGAVYRHLTPEMQARVLAAVDECLAVALKALAAPMRPQADNTGSVGDEGMAAR